MMGGPSVHVSWSWRLEALSVRLPGSLFGQPKEYVQTVLLRVEDLLSSFAYVAVTTRPDVMQMSHKQGQSQLAQSHKTHDQKTRKNHPRN